MGGDNTGIAPTGGKKGWLEGRANCKAQMLGSYYHEGDYQLVFTAHLFAFSCARASWFQTTVEVNTRKTTVDEIPTGRTR